MLQKTLNPNICSCSSVCRLTFCQEHPISAFAVPEPRPTVLHRLHEKMNTLTLCIRCIWTAPVFILREKNKHTIKQTCPLPRRDRDIPLLYSCCNFAIVPFSIKKRRKRMNPFATILDSNRKAVMSPESAAENSFFLCHVMSKATNTSCPCSHAAWFPRTPQALFSKEIPPEFDDSCKFRHIISQYWRISTHP